jgi:predicted nucleic acid-binding protein
VSAKLAVIDTNVLVSGSLNPSGSPGRVLAAVERLLLQPVVSADVMAEYRDVLFRPRLRLDDQWVARLLDNLESLGLMLAPPPIDTTSLLDPGDAPFIALARYAGCPVITGNGRHFVAAGVEVVTPAGWGEGVA